MDKKHRLIIMVCGICGIIGGILVIVAALLDGAVPRPLLFAAAICMLMNTIGILSNLRYSRKQKEADASENSK